MLVQLAGYDAKYAEWLSQNLYRLKENSMKLLEQDGRDSGEFVRYSIVVSFDYEKELKKFKLYTTAGTKGMAPDKRDLLEKAILVTNDSSVTIDLKTMSQILTQFLKLPKLDAYTQELLADEHFNKWIDLL